MNKNSFMSLRKLHGKIHDNWALYKKIRDEQFYIQSIIDRSRELFPEPNDAEIEPSFPVDIIVTWVDGNDPLWLKEKEKYSSKEDINEDVSRYRDWDTLRYWFRAIENFAPWVRYIYFVTWGHVPAWLNIKAEKLRIVRHEDIIPKEYLPTFSSHTIEWNLWRIPGLSEHFLYLNDDVFITKPLQKSDLFCDDLPKYCAIARPMSTYERMNAHRYARLNCYGIINSEYNITESISSNIEKWFNYKYFEEVKYNVRAFQDGFISGMFYSHVGIPFRKSAMEQFCKGHQEAVRRTCKNRFRSAEDIMHQVVQMQEIFEGNFMPIGPRYHGVVTFPTPENIDEIIRFIVEQKYRMICINDHEQISSEDFESIQRKIDSAFDSILPEKSVYELD